MTAEIDSNRVCTRCKMSLPADLDNFPPHKAGKFGLHSQCKSCKKATDAERRSRPDQIQRQQDWRDNNKEKVRLANAKYRANGYCSTTDVKAWVLRNKARSLEADRLKIARYRVADPEKFRLRAKAHYEKNRTAIIAKNLHRYRNNPTYNLRCRTSVRIRKMLVAASVGKTARRQSPLGFTSDELFAHIVSKFTDGMTIEDLLRGDIHIDHIRPVNSFDITGVDCDEFRACWSLSNLQPLWAIDNFRKGGKW